MGWNEKIEVKIGRHCKRFKLKSRVKVVCQSRVPKLHDSLNNGRIIGLGKMHRRRASLL
jgi:hypothetical protein